MATVPDPSAVTALAATLLAQVQQQVQALHQAATSSTTENQEILQIAEYVDIANQVSLSGQAMYVVTTWTTFN